MRFKMMALAAAVSFVNPAFAQTEPVPASSATPEKKVCRNERPATGSIMGGRSICHTRTEWTAIDKANANSVERLRSNTNGRFGTDSGGGYVAK